MKIKVLLYIFILSNSILFSQENITELGVLSSTISETSGLIFYNGKLVTHNDSGNSPQLFEIDTISRQITRTITVTDAVNVDWEDITQDENYIYIGDIGNNNGVRTNLAIYRISKQEYDQSDSVSSEKIDYRYEDQTDFTDNGPSDFDAEALFIIDDQLIILTKQWQSNGTVAYTIPKTIGEHVADNTSDFNIGGLVSGATYNPISEVLFVVGYSSTLSPFVTRFDGSSAADIFGQEQNRTNLNIGLAQVEAITHVGANSYFLTSEFFTRASVGITLDTKLFSFSTTDGIAGEDTEGQEEEEEEEEETEEEEEEEETEEEEEEEEESEEEVELILFRPLNSSFLEFTLNTDRTLLEMAVFDIGGKRINYPFNSDFNNRSIDISTFRSSIYYLTFYFNDGFISKPFLLN